MCRRNSDSLWRKFTIQRAALLNGGLAPRQGGEGKGGRRVVEVVGGPVGKRRSIVTTVPAHGDLSPRARIYFFVFVVHTMSTMAGAMQFSRG